MAPGLCNLHLKVDVSPFSCILKMSPSGMFSLVLKITIWNIKFLIFSIINMGLSNHTVQINIFVKQGVLCLNLKLIRHIKCAKSLS